MKQKYRDIRIKIAADWTMAALQHAEGERKYDSICKGLQGRGYKWIEDYGVHGSPSY